MTVDPKRMTLFQLQMRLALCPERPELWTDHERAVRREYDDRVTALEKQGRAA